MLSQVSPLILAALAALWALVGLGGVGVAISQGNFLWLVLLLPFLFLAIGVAPYRLWRIAQDKSDRLEKDMQPCLQVHGIVENDRGQVGRAWAIKVENLSVNTAEKCHGRLEELEFETPQKNQTLEWVLKSCDLRWAGQQEDRDHEIPGKNFGVLNVIYCETRTNGGPITLAYKDTRQVQLDNALSLRDTILVLVNITCAGKEPIYVLCRAELTLIGSLVTEGYAGRRAVSIVYQGPKRPNIAEYQQQASPPSNPDKEGCLH